MVSIKSLQWGWKKNVPIIKQVTSSECGLACIAMVLSYYGNTIDLSTLRRKYSISSKGMKISEIISVLEDCKITSRALRLEIYEIYTLKTPCILHWGLNHFVVLAGFSNKKIIINDPDLGKRVLSIKEVSKEFTGVALELFPTTKFEKKDEREIIHLKDLFHNISNIRVNLLFIFIMSLAIELIAIVLPMASQVIIDEVIVSDDFDLLITIIISCAILVIFQLFISSMRQWQIIRMSTSIGLEWNAGLFDHLTNLPISYFINRHVGDILSRFGSIGIIQDSITTGIIKSSLDVIMAIGMAVMICIYGGYFSIIVFISVSIDLMMRLLTFPLYREASHEQIQLSSRQQSHFIETIRGITTVKLLSLQKKRRNEWINIVVDIINVRLKMYRYDLIYGRIADILFSTDRLLMLMLGTLAVMHGRFSVGGLIAFLSYKDQFSSRVGTVIDGYFRMRMLDIQTERLSDIVMSETEEKTESIRNPCKMNFNNSPNIECVSVGIRYSQMDSWTVRNINMRIPSGESAVIVGPSGCGKTTILKSMMGLIKPEEGHILVGGSNLYSNNINDYRSIISGVLQDDVLFSGTIADNISGFAENMDFDWLQQCALYAGIIEEIQKMPMGFDTLLGDLGNTLSGGQRQRVMIARALYRRPKLLFLDEATSHLDEKNEILINNTLGALKITRIMVAHRPTTIARASLVFDLT
ncbi:peptidase domain-containing ABC transporter [Acetobacter indonesiensis]